MSIRIFVWCPVDVYDQTFDRHPLDLPWMTNGSLFIWQIDVQWIFNLDVWWTLDWYPKNIHWMPVCYLDYIILNADTYLNNFIIYFLASIQAEGLLIKILSAMRRFLHMFGYLQRYKYKFIMMIMKQSSGTIYHLYITLKSLCKHWTLYISVLIVMTKVMGNPAFARCCAW